MNLKWYWETDFVIPDIGIREFDAGQSHTPKHQLAGMIVGDQVSQDGSRDRRGLIVTTDRAIQEGRKIGANK